MTSLWILRGVVCMVAITSNVWAATVYMNCLDSSTPTHHQIYDYIITTLRITGSSGFGSSLTCSVIFESPSIANSVHYKFTSYQVGDFGVTLSLEVRDDPADSWSSEESYSYISDPVSSDGTDSIYKYMRVTLTRTSIETDFDITLEVFTTNYDDVIDDILDTYSGLAAGIIAAIVVSIIVFIAIIVGIIICCVCCVARAASSGTNTGGVVYNPPVAVQVQNPTPAYTAPQGHPNQGYK